MMEKQQYQDITVTALCAKMHAPRKAFYRYFDTLEDLLNSIIDEVLMESYLFLEVHAELSKYFAYWSKKKYLLDILEKNGLSQILVTRSYERIFAVEQITEIKRKEILFAGYVSALMTMLIIWHHSGMKQSSEEMAAMVDQVFRGRL